ncbi:ATPase, partial [Candidatus Parcubacteria bacterium]
VKHGVIISAPPATVYEALVKHVAQWWNPQHTFSGDSKNLSIDARPGGCFCERLPNGGGLEHLRVIYVAPGEILRMSGALGPLQASGVVGSLTWKLTSAPGGTSVELSYAVGGFMEGGLDGIAPAVNDVLEDQLQRFKLFVETGEPTQGIER